MTMNDEKPDKDLPEDAPQPEAEPEAEAGADAATPPDGEDAAQAETGEMSAEEQTADLKDKLLRALAENENVLRRAKREREDTAKYAISNFARDMLMAADNLRRALDALPEKDGGDNDALAALIDGVKLTERDLLATFERHGIRKIDPMGEKFDHNFHEAMFEVPTTETEPGTVVQVLEVGYVIQDRLLRAARVGIAKAPTEKGEQHTLDTKV